MSFKISNNDNPTKLSVLINHADKWVNIFLDDLGLDADIRVYRIYADDYKENEVHTILMSGALSGLLIGVTAPRNSKVYATDGSFLGWDEMSSKESGHEMTFYGFDQDDNFLVLNWGKVYMIPKEFWNKLVFSVAQITPKTRINDKQL